MKDPDRTHRSPIPDATGERHPLHGRTIFKAAGEDKRR